MKNIWIRSGKEICVCLKDSENELLCAREEFSSTMRLLTGEGVCFAQDSLPQAGESIVIILAMFEQLKDFSEADTYEKSLRGTDGFAVLRQDNNFYIVSHTPNGVYYGAHDFLEKNFKVIFARGANEYGIEFLGEKEWEIVVYDYMEKSPFTIRTWNMCGTGSEGKPHVDFGTAVCYAKNKLNGIFHGVEKEWTAHGLRGCGILSMPANHIDDLIEEHPEYFMTDLDGNPKRSPHESFVNYYSKEAARVVADRLVLFLDKADNRHLYIWGMPDNPYFCMKEGDRIISDEPFTTDEGVTVQPTDKNYKSTVYFNFMNRVIRAVNEVRPNTNILTFAYLYSEQAPAVKIDEHLIVSLAPIYTNEKYAYTDKSNDSNKATVDNIENWSKACSKLCIYSYWNSFKGEIYTRPILRQIKENLLWFENLGVYGITAEGKVDCSLVENMTKAQMRSRKFFDLNEACTWVINKLIWNPRENVDELLHRYATIVYKETAEEFLRYYYLIEQGFQSTDAYVWYPTGGDVYILQFIVQAGIKDDVLQTIRTARDKAITPSVRSRWESICETMEEEIAKYADFIKEEGKIYFCAEKVDICSQKALDYKNNPDSVWNKATPMRVLRNYENMEHYPKEAQFECRMLFDGESLLVGYCIGDDKIKRSYVDNNGVVRIQREDGSLVESYAETYIGGNELNQSIYYGYISGFTAKGKGEFYQNGGTPQKINVGGLQDYYFVKTDGQPKERYYFHVQKIPLTALKVHKNDFKPYGSFVYYTDRFKRAGWMGFGLWSKQNFQPFLIEKS